jgi:hypothetical protein
MRPINLEKPGTDPPLSGLYLLATLFLLVLTGYLLEGARIAVGRQEEKKVERLRGEPDSVAQQLVQFLADKGFV